MCRRPVLPKLPRDYHNKARIDRSRQCRVASDDFYRDVAVLAFPTPPQKGVVPREVRHRSVDKDGCYRPADAGTPRPASGSCSGIGHVSTGVQHPPARCLAATGLECDRLNAPRPWTCTSRTLSAKLKADAGPVAGRAMVATHIDSWESGLAKLDRASSRPSFSAATGTACLPYPPRLRCQAAGSTAGLQSGLQSVSLGFLSNHQRHARGKLFGPDRLSGSRPVGIRFTMEGYDLPFGDEATYTVRRRRTDDGILDCQPRRVNPHNATQSFRDGVSGARLRSQPIVGAEAFTSGRVQERVDGCTRPRSNPMGDLFLSPRA